MDEELHKQIKIKAVMEGLTIQDYILNLIKNDLAKSSK
ncbi:MAG TPA: hypothetical protein GX497_12725 [Bacillus bacterium]|nr:hypothetical protein [Bacillus sp. (in: firmicutes)]